jgi:hypothetical protein
LTATLPDWIAAGATVIGVGIAWSALDQWQSQLRGTTRHNVAVEIAVAAGRLRLHFYSARAPLVFASEFPMSYHGRTGKAHDATGDEAADAYAHVYSQRFAQLHPIVMEMVDLIGKAEVIVDKELAHAVEALARKALELQYLWQEAVHYKRAGESAVIGYNDQSFVTRVRLSSHAIRESPVDPLSKEFDAAYAHVLALVRDDIR